MEESFLIDKTRILPEYLDYQALRAKGLQYIEDLSKSLWTDYNEHDPGVTILESICFAITELGYRTDFDIVDLLADKDGTTYKNQTFFTARDILTIEPVTVEDYRKLLVDMIGVHNAWMLPRANVDTLEADDTIPVTPVPLYPFCEKDALVYAPTDHDAIDIRGLYDILLDLDEVPQLGDLNSGNIIYTFSSGPIKNTQIEFLFPRWNLVDMALLQEIITDGLPVQSIAVTPYAAGKPWTITVTYTLGSGTKTFSYYAVITLRQPIANLEKLVENKIKELKDDGVTPDPAFPLTKIIVAIYQQKILQTTGLIQAARQRYHAHRDLCEDLLNIDTVIPVEVGISADIEVVASADIEEVLANVYFGIEQYLNPSVRFYSLGEMVDKNIPAEEIFEGPKLDHGFIDTTELMNTQLRTDIHVSDLIHIIMDIEGVLAVKNVLISRYDDLGQVVLPSQKWCLHLNKNEKPVLNINRSKILFFKDKLPFRAKPDETQDILSVLEGIAEKNKISGHMDDWPVPTGTFYQMDDYYTIQYEFPQTYGISAAGLSPLVSDERKAEALQLRAYLMFCDQLLADFFSQLFHARDLFSLDTTITQTYYTQFLTDIRDVNLLYRDTIEPHSLLSVKLSDALAAPDFGSVVVAQTTANNNQHARLIESKEKFYDRRNRFLDHLLARFAESFNDYVLMLYNIVGTDKIAVAEDKMILDKIAFLKDYPVISSERGKAFDYLTASWGTSNVSGLEKRVARLTGIADYTRRNLFCLFPITLNVSGVAPALIYSFTATGVGNDLVSLITWTDPAAVDTVINKVYANITLAASYSVDSTNPAQIFVLLKDEFGSGLAKSNLFFADVPAANTFIAAMITRYGPTCQAEGLFLIEHLLLRPHFVPTPVLPETPEENYEPLQVCLAKDCAFCGEEDPYSFRASVILPYWPERFRDMDFRKFFEKTMRTEAPAHITLKICWVNFTSMQRFQDIYQRWLAALADYESDLFQTIVAKQDTFRKVNNELVEYLATVHSEYPEARLHDCDTGITNPVLLGSTVLGSF